MDNKITRGRRVTLRDVADRAGVSLKTASNVINKTGRMTDDTRQKVQDAIKELGYQINVAARNLSRNKTGFIMLAVPSLTPPYLAELANRTIDAARLHNYSVYATTYAEGSARGARALLKSFNPTICDGMILSMSEMEDFSQDDLEVSYPLVTLGARTTWGLADHVAPDDVDAAAQATRYLIERGSQHLAVIGSRQDFDRDSLMNAVEGNAQLRLRGIIEECQRSQVFLDPRLIGNTGYDWTIGSGARVTQRLIASGLPFDGIVALNDQLAIGALFALREKGIDVPGQVQVIGFDNIEEAAYLQIPLTSMDSRLTWTAPTAVNRLLERINTGNLVPENFTAQSSVVARSTTRN